MKFWKTKYSIFMMTDLRLWSIVTDGLCHNSPPKESKGSEAAVSLGNLGNCDVCVWAKHLIPKRLKISWN